MREAEIAADAEIKKEKEKKRAEAIHNKKVAGFDVPDDAGAPAGDAKA